MKFVTIANEQRAIHYNVEHITDFNWYDGVLHIGQVGRENMDSYNDPERIRYLKLCDAVGTTPAEPINSKATP